MGDAKVIESGTGGKAWLATILAWLVPGAGHLWQGRWQRAMVLGGAVYLMYFLGLYWGGHLYGPHNYEEIGMLAYVFGVCNLGTGLVYFFSLASDFAILNQAQLATSEYGDRFFMVAGLLNYLLVLDVYDLLKGRKS